MSKIGIIVKREYMRRVAKKSFILLTFLMPFLFVALVTVPLILSNIQDDEINDVVVIDKTNSYEEIFEDTDSYHFIMGDKDLEAYRTNDKHSASFYITINDNLLKDPTAIVMYSEQLIPRGLKSLIESRLNTLLTNQKIESYNIPNLNEIIKESKASVDISTIKWSKDGENVRSSSEVAGIIGMVFTFIIYMFIISYGGMVMQGVMEEKTNRIVEVMISSVKPFQLMMGKIIGIALVGLTQLMMWIVLTIGLFFVGTSLLGTGADAETAQMGMEMGMGAMATPSNSDMAHFYEIINSINIPEIVIMFIIYFLGGYLLYASIFAAIGASVENQEDTQQFMMPIIILLVFGLYTGVYSMNNPNGPLALWTSFIPFTSPVVMMVRTPFDVPIWQEILSIALLFITALAIVWVSAKIYRVGILMYGKKPSFKEMIKWIKYR